MKPTGWQTHEEVKEDYQRRKKMRWMRDKNLVFPALDDIYFMMRGLKLLAPGSKRDNRRYRVADGFVVLFRALHSMFSVAPDLEYNYKAEWIGPWRKTGHNEFRKICWRQKDALTKKVICEHLDLMERSGLIERAYLPLGRGKADVLYIQWHPERLLEMIYTIPAHRKQVRAALKSNHQVEVVPDEDAAVNIAEENTTSNTNGNGIKAPKTDGGQGRETVEKTEPTEPDQAPGKIDWNERWLRKSRGSTRSEYLP